jgi:Tol biopolymer transport system component
VVIVAAIFAFWLARWPPPAPLQLRERRLTANSSENAVHQGAISPDGKYLAYADATGMHLKLIQTGETIAIPPAEGSARVMNEWWPNGWFPDSTKFVATGIEPGTRLSAWVVSVLGGPPRELREDADVWSVSPDGTLTAFGTGLGPMHFREIWLMGAQGEQARRFVSGSEDDGFFWAAWSPDGKRIAFGKYHRMPDKLECSIETRDLEGGHPAVIVSDPRLCADNMRFSWFPSGRFVYIIPGPEEGGQGDNLWDVRVDTRTGEPVSKPRQLTNWTGVGVGQLGGTSDGKELAVTRLSMQADVYVGELGANGRRLRNPRRLTLNENDDYPGGWMPDSKAVLFQSNRNGTWDIFKQALDQAEAQPVVTGADYKRPPVLSPDGSWILYLSSATAQVSPATPVRIMRVPSAGGAPELVVEGRGIDHLACARSPATLCAFSEPSPDQKQLIFSAFDPLQGKGRELTRINFRKQPPQMIADVSWDLSGDGLRLAFTQFGAGEGRIGILPLAGGEAREVNVKGWNGFYGLSWATDGKGLFVGALPIQTLLYVDLEGRADVLWKQTLSFGSITWGVPSPDGRHLALAGYGADSNVWLLENF